MDKGEASGMMAVARLKIVKTKRKNLKMSGQEQRKESTRERDRTYQGEGGSQREGTLTERERAKEVPNADL